MICVRFCIWELACHTLYLFRGPDMNVKNQQKKTTNVQFHALNSKQTHNDIYASIHIQSSYFSSLCGRYVPIKISQGSNRMPSWHRLIFYSSFVYLPQLIATLMIARSFCSNCTWYLLLNIGITLTIFYILLKLADSVETFTSPVHYECSF